jgi:transcriptional regulator with XRE-family HTH domain
MSTKSLRKLAQELGVSQPFLTQIRQGKRPIPEGLRAKAEAIGAYHLLIKTGDDNLISACLAPVPVAQGIERLPSKQRVAGSNPAWDATCSTAIRCLSGSGSLKRGSQRLAKQLFPTR